MLLTFFFRRPTANAHLASHTNIRTLMLNLWLISGYCFVGRQSAGADGTVANGICGRRIQISTNLVARILILLASGICTAQQVPLTYPTYLALVREHHPIARQTALLMPQADAELLLARGMFDTKMYSTWQQKSFDGKHYYTESHSGFKTPSWYGLTWKTEYLTQRGLFTNPESSLPIIGQGVAGIEVSALQGLLIDERRTALRLAQQLSQVNANERARLLNDLFLDASLAYWNWVAAYQQLMVLRNARTLAVQRYQGIEDSYLAGDKPAIDTLEAWTQVLTRDAELIEAQQYAFETAQKMAVFVWDAQQQPLEATESLTPEITQLLTSDVAIQIATESNAVAQIAATHPELLKYQLKQQTLEIERRWKREKLKPRLQLEYNFLGNGLNFGPPAGSEGVAGVMLQNYKWGICFSQPLFLRKERAELRLNSLKLQENQLDLSLKRQDLSNKIKIAANKLTNARAQVQMLEQITRNLTALQEAEIIRFQIGESSIFLINTRENKRLESELKLAKARAELKKAEAEWKWITASW